MKEQVIDGFLIPRTHDTNVRSPPTSFHKVIPGKKESIDD